MAKTSSGKVKRKSPGSAKKKQARKLSAKKTTAIAAAKKRGTVRKKAPAARKRPLIGSDPFAEMSAPLPGNAGQRAITPDRDEKVKSQKPAVPAEPPIGALPVAPQEIDLEHIEMPPMPVPEASTSLAESRPASEEKSSDSEPSAAVDEPAADEESEPGAAVSPDVFALPEALVLQTAAAVYPDFEQALDREGDLRIDAGAVTRVDTAGMQLLLALAHSARQRGRKLEIQNAGELIVGKAKILGFSADLGL